MIAFVTGATGFVGHHLVSRLLELGHEVRCLVESRSSDDALQGKPVSCLEGNLCDPALASRLKQSLRGAEVVFHLAGVTRAASAKQFMQVNARGVEVVAQGLCGAVVPSRDDPYFFDRGGRSGGSWTGPNDHGPALARVQLWKEQVGRGVCGP